jgi:hypothetical protein
MTLTKLIFDQKTAFLLLNRKSSEFRPCPLGNKLVLGIDQHIPPISPKPGRFYPGLLQMNWTQGFDRIYRNGLYAHPANY